MLAITVDSADEAYKTLFKEIMTTGKTKSPRGMKTKYLSNVIIEHTNPRNRFIFDIARKLHPKTQLAEFMWYMTNNPSVGVITPYIKHWESFANDDGTVNSQYGVLWSRQIDGILKKIRNDVHTRQAVISIYSEEFNNYYGKDVPCTVLIQFKVRECNYPSTSNILDMTIYMRSNDLVYGYCIDQFVFSLLQELVANELDMEVGTYVHHVNDLHIYEDKFDMFPGKKENYKQLRSNYTDIKYTNFWKSLKNLDALPDFDLLKNIITTGNIDVSHFTKNIID